MATAAGCTAPNERHAHTTGKINLCCQFAHIIIFTQLFFIFLFPPGTVVSFYAIFFSCISLCITNKLSSAPSTASALKGPRTASMPSTRVSVNHHTHQPGIVSFFLARLLMLFFFDINPSNRVHKCINIDCFPSMPMLVQIFSYVETTRHTTIVSWIRSGDDKVSKVLRSSSVNLSFRCTYFAINYSKGH